MSSLTERLQKASTANFYDIVGQFEENRVNFLNKTYAATRERKFWQNSAHANVHRPPVITDKVKALMEFEAAEAASK